MFNVNFISLIHIVAKIHMVSNNPSAPGYHKRQSSAFGQLTHLLHKSYTILRMGDILDINEQDHWRSWVTLQSPSQ